MPRLKRDPDRLDTAVVGGLAQAIHRGEVPERMQSRRDVALDMARDVAGTQYRGQFEERLKKIIDETKRNGSIILFLDEIHTMVGAGGAEGAMEVLIRAAACCFSRRLVL